MTGIAVTLRNLILTGELLLWSDCPATEEWCKHCLNEELLLPDHSTPIEGFKPSTLSSDVLGYFQCSSTQDTYFFLVANRDASLTLDSCEVKQIRSRPTAIFLAFNSALTFINTHFFALAPAKHPAAVIYFPASLAALSNVYLRGLPHELLEACYFPHCGRLEILGGSVQGLNRDHSFTTSNDMESGFLLGFSLKLVRLVQVHFLDNQLSTFTKSSRGFITLEETSLLEVTGCSFAYCMGVTGAIYLRQARTSANPGAYNDPQILISDTTFTGLFSQVDASVLNIHSTGLNPIVLLSNVTFESAHSFSGSSVIWLDFNSEAHSGNFNLTSHDDPLQQIYTLTPGRVRFDSLVLRSCVLYDETGSHLHISGAEHVEMVDVTLANNTYAHGSLATIFEHFVEEGLHPWLEETQSRFAVVEGCLAAVSLDNVSEVLVLRWNVEGTGCDAGVELISPRNSVSLEALQARGNLHVLLVSHTNSFPLLVSACHFQGNMGAALIQNFNKRQTISTHQAVTIFRDCYFLDNIDLEGRAGLIYYGGNITVTNCRFLRNQGSANAGLYAFLLFSAPGQVAQVVVQDSIFAANAVVGYFAPDIHIESISKVSQSPQVITISRCSFSNSQGGSIALDELRLGQGPQRSTIQDCVFTDTRTTILGVLHSTHISGELLVSRCHFLRCQAPHSNDHCGISVLSNTSTALNPTFTEVKDCLFEQTRGSSCVYVEASSLQQSSLATTRCVFRDNAARAVTNAGGYYSDQSSQFLNNSAAQGGAYLAEESSHSVLLNSTFAGNHAELQGGALDISGPLSVAVLRGCLVVNNSAIKGGAATFENNVAAVLEDTVFRNNSAKAASALSVSDIQTTILVLRNCSLWHNTGEEVVIASGAAIQMERTSIGDNWPLHSASGFLLQMSVLNSSDCVFEALRGVSGCAVDLLLESEWHDQGSTLRTSTCASSVVEAQESLVSLSSTKLQGLSVTLFAVLYVHRQSRLLLNGVHFEDNVAVQENSSVVLCQEASLTILNSHFQRSKGNTLLATTCHQVLIAHSSFLQSIASGEATLWLLNPDQVTITDSEFRGLAGRTAGALHLRRDDSHAPLLIRNCTFEQCTGLAGGVRLSGVTGLIEESRFLDNVATGYGGGLYLNSTQGVNLTGCEFTSNQAVLGGGGFFWVEATPPLQDTIFANNSAAYGQDLASDASHIQLDNVSADLLDRFPSGQVLNSPLKISLIDELKQVVTTVNNLYAKITANRKEVLVSGSIEAKSVNGQFSFEGFALTAVPGLPHNIIIEVDNMHVKNLNLTVQFRNCELGEVLVDKACSVCPLNTYSLELGAALCRPCPSGAECLGGLQLYPLAGYWRASVTSDILWPCFSGQACSGSANYSSLEGLCADGYEGQVCQSCSMDWARTGRDDCAVCPALSLTMLRVLGLCIVGVICLVFLVRSTMINIKSGRLTSVYFRIFLNYLQLTMLTSTFDLKWPEAAKQLFNTQDAVGGASQQFFSYDCVYYQVGYTDPVLFQDLAVTAVMPLIAVVISTCVWAIVSIKTREWTYLKQQNVLSMVVVFFVVYPKLVNSTFSLFNCIDVLPGELWLRRDMAIRCWDHKHTLYAFGLALPSIALWVLGTPLLVLFLLYRTRLSLHSPSVRLRFGFMYMGYSPPHYYWEFVTLARKIAVLSVLSFTSSSSVQVQALTVLIVLLLALLLQLRFQPFLSAELNQLEFKSILTSAVTLICGLYYLASGLNVWLQLLLLVLIIAANAYFVISWAKCLLMVYAVQVVAYCPTCCSCLYDCFPSLRSLVSTQSPRVFPGKEGKYDPELDDLSSADLSNSHRDRSKIVPEPITFNVADPSVPPTPPDNTPQLEPEEP